MTYPVHFTAEQPPRFTRAQLLIRLAVFAVLGICGVSFGSAFAAAYLLLPLYAAIRIASLGGAAQYLREDRTRLKWALHWFGAVSAWTGLVAERLPARVPEETVSLAIESRPFQPTAPAAALRILTGVPSFFVLMLLCMLGSLVWLWAGLSVLASERIGSGAFQYLLGLSRWSVRLLAYQACLVEDYPPFSFSDYEPHGTAIDLPV